MTQRRIINIVNVLLFAVSSESAFAVDWSTITVPVSFTTSLGVVQNDAFFLNPRVVSLYKLELFPNYPWGSVRIGPHLEYGFQRQLNRVSFSTDTNLLGRMWSLGLAARVWFTNRLYAQLAIDPLGSLSLGRPTETGKSAAFKDLLAGYHVRAGYRAFRRLPQLTLDLDFTYYQYRNVEISGNPSDWLAGTTGVHTLEWTGGIGLTWRLGPWLPAYRPPEVPKSLEATRSGDSLEMTIPSTSFDHNSSDLKPDAIPTLKGLAEALIQNPDQHIYIEGYTDSIGGAEYNLKLSQARAESVRTYLMENGLPDHRITAQGFGENQPMADNSTSDGRARNRRVQIRVEQMKDSESGGGL